MPPTSRSSYLPGAVIIGVMIAFKIPRKAVAEEVGMDESTFSRKINEREYMQPEDVLQIGMAIGKLQSKKAL